MNSQRGLSGTVKTSARNTAAGKAPIANMSLHDSAEENQYPTRFANTIPKVRAN
jgi:hypothetical protein